MNKEEFKALLEEAYMMGYEDASIYHEFKIFRKRLPNKPSKLRTDVDDSDETWDYHIKAPAMRKKLKRIKPKANGKSPYA